MTFRALPAELDPRLTPPPQPRLPKWSAPVTPPAGGLRRFLASPYPSERDSAADPDVIAELRRSSSAADERARAAEHERDEVLGRLQGMKRLMSQVKDDAVAVGSANSNLTSRVAELTARAADGDEQLAAQKEQEKALREELKQLELLRTAEQEAVGSALAAGQQRLEEVQADARRRIAEAEAALQAERRRCADSAAALSAAKELHARTEAEAASARGKCDDLSRQLEEERKRHGDEEGALRARCEDVSGQLAREQARHSEESSALRAEREAEAELQERERKQHADEAESLRASGEALEQERDSVRAKFEELLALLEREREQRRGGEADLRAECERLERERDDARAECEALTEQLRRERKRHGDEEEELRAACDVLERERALRGGEEAALQARCDQLSVRLAAEMKSRGAEEEAVRGLAEQLEEERRRNGAAEEDIERLRQRCAALSEQMQEERAEEAHGLAEAELGAMRGECERLREAEQDSRAAAAECMQLQQQQRAASATAELVEHSAAARQEAHASEADERLAVCAAALREQLAAALRGRERAEAAEAGAEEALAAAVRSRDDLASALQHLQGDLAQAETECQRLRTELSASASASASARWPPCEDEGAAPPESPLPGWINAARSPCSSRSASPTLQAPVVETLRKLCAEYGGPDTSAERPALDAAVGDVAALVRSLSLRGSGEGSPRRRLLAAELAAAEQTAAQRTAECDLLSASVQAAEGKVEGLVRQCSDEAQRADSAVADLSACRAELEGLQHLRCDTSQLEHQVRELAAKTEALELEVEEERSATERWRQSAQAAESALCSSNIRPSDEVQWLRELLAAAGSDVDMTLDHTRDLRAAAMQAVGGRNARRPRAFRSADDEVAPPAADGAWDHELWACADGMPFAVAGGAAEGALSDAAAALRSAGGSCAAELSAARFAGLLAEICFRGRGGAGDAIASAFRTSLALADTQQNVTAVQTAPALARAVCAVAAEPLPPTASGRALYRTLQVPAEVSRDHRMLEQGTLYGWAAPAFCTANASCAAASAAALAGQGLLFVVSGAGVGVHTPRGVLLPPLSLFTVTGVCEAREGYLQVHMDWKSTRAGAFSEEGGSFDGDIAAVRAELAESERVRESAERTCEALESIATESRVDAAAAERELEHTRSELAELSARAATTADLAGAGASLVWSVWRASAGARKLAADMRKAVREGRAVPREAAELLRCAEETEATAGRAVRELVAESEQRRLSEADGGQSPGPVSGADNG
eukprot:TRINITY_DN14189_c0_g1_i2.p1 TRINITY_DN14189_c0_g1~~TRINITY_DN14189_c0_g1_i2.p1  ORF type:complete len:1294 (+),score=567.00 TRINITY_DN14189_c0_g1_i2:126-3884(+)